MIDPGDLAQINALVEQKLREFAPQQDRKARARADADAFLKDLRRRDPPSAPLVPVTHTETTLPIQRLDFFSDPAQQGTGGSSSPAGFTLAYPGADGVYALKWSSSGAVLEQVLLDQIEVGDCSTGTTVTRKFLALPVP